MVDRSYLHQLDPFAIQFTESIGLRWYGLAYIAGFLVAWAGIRWMGQRKQSFIPPNRAGDFIFAGVLGILIGGRLGYCLFYSPSLLYTFTSDFPFWKLLAIQDGGMASHGGMIGVAVAFILWGRKNNISILHLFDISALFATPGLFFGRIANFVNAELWGRALPQANQPNPPAWSVKYPTEITEVWLQQPIVYQEQLSELENLRTSTIGSEPFYQALVQELQAGNTTVIESVQPLLTAWYPSQLFQAIAEGPFLFLALIVVWWTPKKPGIVASSFLILYGVARIATEMFRQPDEGISIIIGLSRGQLLSVLMVICGAGLLLYTSNRSAAKTGGFCSVTKTTSTTA